MALTSGSDGKVRIFDVRRRDCLSSWTVASSPSSAAVAGVALSQDETAVYALTADGVFSAWSVYQVRDRDSFFCLIEYVLLR